MTQPIVVEPQGFLTAAHTYADIHTGTLVPAITALSTTLATCAGSAGSDNAGRAWSSDYDPAAYDTVDALGDLALACGQMHDLLQHSGANHANANSQSGPDPNPNALVYPPGSLTVYQPPEPPKAFGGNDPEPTGWSWVKGAVQGELWPNGEPGKLRTAATAWRAMATQLRTATVGLPGARQHIDNQQSPETGQALEQHDLVKGQFDALAGICDQLAGSCDSYANSLEQTKKHIVEALIEMVGFIVADQAVGGAIAFFTGGGSEAAAQGGMALLISMYGARIANTIRALIGLADLAKVPIGVSQAIARGAETLIPLLKAEPALAGTVDGATAPGSFTSWANLRRPELREPTKRTIEAAATKWGPRGGPKDFYEVASETDVKVPINKSYDDKPWVTQLPKDPTGKYYVDATNQSLYPVNPKWEYGHNSGYENRRLIANAQSEGMTQQQFNDYVNNNPQYFHVEDHPGNRSHRREQK